MKKGFTLVEILIALLILAIGIVGLFNIFPSAWNSFAYSRKLSQVALLAEQKLEALNSAQDVVPGVTTGEEGEYAWRLTISPVSFEQPGIALMQAELDITFSIRDMPLKERFITYL